MAAKGFTPVQGPAPVYRVRDAKPLTGAKKSAATRSQARAAAAGEAKRSSFEDSVVGQSRMKQPGVMEGTLSPASVYREMGWHDNSRHSSNQQTLPGMESLASGRQAGLVSHGQGTLPDTVPVARLKHLSTGEHSSVEAHAARFGVTRASAKAAFSTNLDQAYANSDGQPHARDFYVDQSPHMPAGHIVQAAKDSGRSASSIASATAITSPQTEWGPTAEGNYPNIRAARQAAIHVGPPSAVEHPRVSDDSTKKIGTFTGNVRKAVTAVRQQDDHDVLAADLRGASTAANPRGSKLFGGPNQQKTTAFRNALVDPEGPEASFVSDVHSGGRGMAPHLSPEEAGAYLKHPGIHQWHDDIAREVMHERGLQSVNNVQAAQWGQAQLDSTAASRVQVPRASRSSTHSPGQLGMFDEHPQDAASADDQHWTPGDQKRMENGQAKRRRQGISPPVDPEARKAGW